jgi:hypothetical protein
VRASSEIATEQMSAQSPDMSLIEGVDDMILYISLGGVGFGACIVIAGAACAVVQKFAIVLFMFTFMTLLASIVNLAADFGVLADTPFPIESSAYGYESAGLACVCGVASLFAASLVGCTRCDRNPVGKQRRHQGAIMVTLVSLCGRMISAYLGGVSTQTAVIGLLQQNSAGMYTFASSLGLFILSMVSIIAEFFFILKMVKFVSSYNYALAPLPTMAAAYPKAPPPQGPPPGPGAPPPQGPPPGPGAPPPQGPPPGPGAPPPQGGGGVPPSPALEQQLKEQRDEIERLRKMLEVSGLNPSPGGGMAPPPPGGGGMAPPPPGGGGMAPPPPGGGGMAPPPPGGGGMAPPPPLPTGWQSFYDATGSAYYYDTSSGATTYDRPSAQLGGGLAAPPQPFGSAAGYGGAQQVSAAPPSDGYAIQQQQLYNYVYRT